MHRLSVPADGGEPFALRRDALPGDGDRAYPIFVPLS